MDIEFALNRLNSQLPLAARQKRLAPEEKRLHQAIVRSLVQRGMALTRAEAARYVGEPHVAAALQKLGALDLIVLNSDATVVLGAYPVTTEVTPHRLSIATHSIGAMCALDAVSVAPMFSIRVGIASRCRVSGEPVDIQMHDRDLLAVHPRGVMIGVRWQMPCGVAAHSMCTEMVFLRDGATAREWQGPETDTASVFSLTDAVEFGAAFFGPLMSP